MNDDERRPRSPAGATFRASPRVRRPPQYACRNEDAQAHEGLWGADESDEMLVGLWCIWDEREALAA